MNKGFTLIEVIVYIGLFSILMVGVLTTAYNLLEGSEKLNTKNFVEEEGSFVLRKIKLALTGIDPASTPAITGSGCFQSISINKTDASLNPTVLRLNTISSVNYVEISENSGPFYPITTSNASTTCLKFNSISGSPLGVSATTTINGIDFAVTKYLRK